MKFLKLFVVWCVVVFAEGVRGEHGGETHEILRGAFKMPPLPYGRRVSARVTDYRSSTQNEAGTWFPDMGAAAP